MSMEFKVITPDSVVLQTKVTSVTVPGSLGQLEILDHHTALISALEPGELTYIPVGGSPQHLIVGTGFVQVNQDHILMVTDLALESGQIDESSVEQAIAQAQAALQQRSSMSQEEQALFEANLTKQLAMLSFKRKHRNNRT